MCFSQKLSEMHLNTVYAGDINFQEKKYWQKLHVRSFKGTGRNLDARSELTPTASCLIWDVCLLLPRRLVTIREKQTRLFLNIAFNGLIVIHRHFPVVNIRQSISGTIINIRLIIPD